MNDKDKMLLDDIYQLYGRMSGGFGESPEHITLNLKYPLRPYQHEAIGRYLYHYDNDKTRNSSQGLRLLFNMATGSGKTIIMAALMLDLYKRGHRKFVFFVNTTNIIEKTRENFLDQSSSKYLFAEKIIVDGCGVEVREVSDFSNTREDAINVVFTTIQGLHTQLKSPRENGLTFEELEDHDIVFLSDEAHHLNGDTKKLAADEKKDNVSWEGTINTILANNSNNSLLEFTATIDLHDKEIFYKYKDRIIYRYDLRAFREDGYSKDVWIYDVAADVMDRAIEALIISQYRKKIALDHGILLKPVVLFKSFRIADSNEFFDQFIEKMKVLSVADIDKQRPLASGILKRAFDYYDTEGISDQDLADELRIDFSEERLIAVTKSSIAPEDQQRLNSLEDKDNEIRAVFAVNVLDEGWDVLNLFDIVRLYDTRDSKSGKVGRTTLAEAQLIGRGARYYPFVVSNNEEKRYKRKFDENELEPLRVIEQLHYHSASNPKYIQEIRQTLREKGILSGVDPVSWEIILKDGFKSSRTYAHGVIFKNEQVEKPALGYQTALFGGEGYNIPDEYPIDVPVGVSHDRQIFVDNTNIEAQSAQEKYTFTVPLKKFPRNLIRHAADRNKKLRYDTVSEKIHGLSSLEAFLTADSQLGGCKIAITAGVDKFEKLTVDEKFFIVEELLDKIAGDLNLTKKSYIGTKEFTAYPIKNVFDDHILRNYTLTDNDAEFGISQSIPGDYHQRGSRFFLDLSKEDWHAYSDNFGTSEEKKLVLLMKKLIEDLQQKWSDIYLLRNEGAFKIYEFNSGQAFEPDYVLFANDKQNASVSWQVFIEPKGGHLVEHDAWKQDFLLKISEEAGIIGENSDVKLIGVPFFNSDIEAQTHVIEEALKTL
jgi:type III restriction enzyme